MRITLHTLAALLGVLLAVAPVLAERPEDERVCGVRLKNVVIRVVGCMAGAPAGSRRG